SRRMRPDFDHTHQSALRVIQDVAVKHPYALDPGTVIVADDDAEGLLVWHIDGVLPGKRPGWLPFVVKNLKEKPMKMKRVGPLGLVLDRPDLRFVNTRQYVLRLIRRDIVDPVFDIFLIHLDERHIDLDIRRTRGIQRFDGTVCADFDG